MLRSLLFILICSVAFAEEIDLSKYEKSIYSSHGEDGVLARIFQLIAPSSKFCVEIGARDGLSDSSTYFLRLQGWKALLLDRSFESSSHNLHKEFIIAENISQLFDKYQVPTFGLDLLSINISYNSYHLWKGLDAKYQPAVVVIKYNAQYWPDENVVARYRPFFCGDNSTNFGASIRALYDLGRSKNYSLVYAESSAMKLFFIRDDLLKEKNLQFKNMNQVEKIYRPPYEPISIK